MSPLTPFPGWQPPRLFPPSPMTSRHGRDPYTAALEAACVAYSVEVGRVLDRAYRWREVYDVRVDGVVADGLTDDTSALQRAFDNGDGRPFLIPGLVAVQPDTLILPDGAVLIGLIPPSKRYLAADIIASEPSYFPCSGLQLVQGAHGALFRCGAQTPANEEPSLTLVNLVLRHGEAGRTSADVACDVAPWKALLLGCRIENLAAAFKVQAPATGMDITLEGCQLVHTDTVVSGSVTKARMVTCQGNVESNTTWTGPAHLEVRGCDFQAGGSHIIIDGAESVLLHGNVHDLSGDAAVKIIGDVEHGLIVDSMFRTSGADLVDAAGRRSHIYLNSIARVVQVSGCSFSWPHYDSSPILAPDHILELDDAAGSWIEFEGNITRRGCIDIPVRVTGSSAEVLRADDFMLDACVGSPGGTVGSPNTASDILSAAVVALHTALADEQPPVRLTLFDNRKCIADCDARKLLVIGRATPNTIDLSAAPMTFDRAHQITLGTFTCYELGGQSIAFAAPSGLQAEGRWLQAKRVYNFAPAIGNPMGWVNITATATLPQTWRPLANVL